MAFLLAVAILSGCGSRREAAAPPVGLWQTKLEYPGLTVRIGLRIVEMAGGRLRIALLRPDQTGVAVEADESSFDGESLRVLFESVDAGFEGRFDSGNGQLYGEWRQGARRWTVVWESVAEIVPRPRPQTPLPPYPYIEEDVFVDAAEGVRLAGTLTLPDATGVFPAALLVSGVGAQDRDGTFLEHRPFRVLADDLARRGVAVLRYDDRGAGESTGDRSQATSADYADDALAAVRWLRGHPNVDPDRVGLVGHSEGGTIAMLAAASSDVAFVVLLGAPGLPGVEYNLQFEESVARALGQSETQIAVKREFQTRVLEIVQRATEPTAARRELRQVYRDLPGVSDAQIEATIDHLLSPGFRFQLDHDPRDTLAGTTCPVLAVFGALDVQVPPEGNLEAMESALQERGGVYRVVEVENVNHFFQTAATGSPLEYGEITETMAPGLMNLVAAWVLEDCGVLADDSPSDAHGERAEPTP